MKLTDNSANTAEEESSPFALLLGKEVPCTTLLDVFNSGREVELVQIVAYTKALWGRNLK